MKYVFALLIILLAEHANAQDTHYWSEHFGTRATLLGGAATAGLGDNATVYYNPAAMAFIDDPNLSVTVNAYKMRIQKVSNALGDGLDLRQIRLATYPNLIAGILKFNKWPRLSAGYAVITKKTFNSSFDYLHQNQYDVDSNGTMENYIASYNYNHNVLEYWAGGGFSYQISAGWAFGFSHFGIYKNVNYSNNIDMSALPITDPTADPTRVASKIDFSYWSVKGNFKPSLSFQSEKFKFGVAYTTPTFHVMGRATVFREFSVTNLGGADVVFTKVKAQTKDAGALAFGISIRFGAKAWLHLSNELFFGLPYYLIFDPPNTTINVYPDTIAQDEGYILQAFGRDEGSGVTIDQNFLAYGERYTAITNSGIGYEVRFSDKWDMMTGVRLDFNYFLPKDQYYTLRHIVIESSKWQNTQWSVGFGCNTKSGKKWTIGIEYNYIPGFKFFQFMNFTSPEESRLLTGVRTQDASSRQFSLKLVVGIQFGGANSAPLHLEGTDPGEGGEGSEEGPKEEKKNKKDKTPRR